MNEPKQAKPDVEAIINEIQRDMDAASAAVPAPLREAVNEGDDLHGHLAEVNRAWRSGDAMITGWRRHVMRPFLPWLSDINTFHSSVVRVLNRLVKLLEGEDLPEAGPILDRQQRRLTLAERMNERLAAYDQLEIEQRLKHLEARLAALEKDRQA